MSIGIAVSLFNYLRKDQLSIVLLVFNSFIFLKEELETILKKKFPFDHSGDSYCFQGFFTFCDWLHNFFCFYNKY